MSLSEGKCPVIGLVGAIGAGKSEVGGIFARHGAVVIDADDIARRVLDWKETRERIAREFGESVFENGGVSRQALADLVFADGSLLLKLNAIVHPIVIAESKRIINATRREGSCRGIILDAPLLVEAGIEDLCDCIVFVDASEDVRTRRLADSRGWDGHEISRREKFQESLISKRKRADYTIDNSGALSDTIRQVSSIWQSVAGT